MSDLPTSEEPTPKPAAAPTPSAAPDAGASTTETPPPADKPRPGRLLAVLALLLALGAGGGAGYVLWRSQAADARAAGIDATFRAELAALQQRMDMQAASEREESSGTMSRLEAQIAAIGEQQAELRAALDAVVEAEAGPVAAAPGAWRHAEAEYLLRVANRRLLLERDRAGARDLLALADRVLAEGERFAYHDVRALLADEIAALDGMDDVDVQGIFLRIEALKDAIASLPLTLPGYAASSEDQTGATTPPRSLLQTLGDRLAGLVRFRRHDGEPVRPLLPSRQAQHLELHLRLAFDRAQLAALRYDAAIYRASLDAARDWLERYVDQRASASANMAAQIDALLTVDLQAQLPDISRSLAKLRELRGRRDAAQEDG